GVIENGEALVSGELISAVGVGLTDKYPHEPVRDLGCCALMPGFVNAHCHIDYTMSRNRLDGLNLWDWIDAVGFRKGRAPDYELILASAKLGCAELALSGVTCLGDSSFSGAAASAIDQMGLRGIVYKEIFGQSMGANHADGCAAAVDSVGELQAGMSDRVKIGLSPHSVYTSNIEVLRFCAESGLPVAIHLAETSAETQYCLDGAGPLADWRRKLGYEPMISGNTPTRRLADAGLLRKGVSLAHCVHVDSKEIAMIAASGASVVHCPRSNAFLGAGIAPITEFIRAGACVGLGTDSAGSCGNLDFFDEMRCALRFARNFAKDALAMTANNILSIATLGGAKTLGLSDIIGSIEPGKRADMIAIDMARMLPCEDLGLAILSRCPSDVMMAMVGGKEILSNGRLASFDIRDLEQSLKAGLESQGFE
ncbi:MAG: amidohydrolase family protein, partial [Armatimonadetes bacterium]|nr:amidohydrolase family protein [Armatimonadota bacterium]